MIPQRITDYLRERRIRALTREINEALREGHREDALDIQPRWVAELKSRSPEQIARMERALFNRVNRGSR